MTEQINPAGHRARLRQRFLAKPTALSDVQLLELLLTYAILRADVAPLAQMLIDRFGNINGVLTASYDELLAIEGVGQQTAILLQVVAQLTEFPPKQADRELQPTLFELDDEPTVEQSEDIEPPETGLFYENAAEFAEPAIHTFVNDEIANALTFIPQAARFENLETFKAYLCERLPYNSTSTRQRRANHILSRFFAGEQLDIPLTYYAARCTTPELKPVLFYHVLKAEPLAAKVAEEFIWPALPVGRVARGDMREFILRYLPDIAASSQQNTLRSLFTTYHLLSMGQKENTTLHFHIHTGTLPAFLYVLTAEFPQPGMYTFDALEESPLRCWLLWDKAWMRRQLYNLRDFGIISKVSEIATIRQFTLQLDQIAALRHYFEHPQRDVLAIREESLPLETSN
jgi:hypothetical protein